MRINAVTILLPRKEEDRFLFFLTILFTGILTYQYVLDHQVKLMLLVSLSFIWTIKLCFSNIFLRMFKLIQSLSQLIQYFLNTSILIVTYFAILLPIALLLKLFRIDLLDRAFSPEEKTYFKDVKRQVSKKHLHDLF